MADQVFNSNQFQKLIAEQIVPQVKLHVQKMMDEQTQKINKIEEDSKNTAKALKEAQDRQITQEKKMENLFAEQKADNNESMNNLQNSLSQQMNQQFQVMMQTFGNNQPKSPSQKRRADKPATTEISQSPKRHNREQQNLQQRSPDGLDPGNVTNNKYNKNTNGNVLESPQHEQVEQIPRDTEPSKSVSQSIPSTLLPHQNSDVENSALSSDDEEMGDEWQ